MECREDVIKIGQDLLERPLTEEEVDELTKGMEELYSSYCETYDKDVDVDALFNEDFYDALKELLDEMEMKKQRPTPRLTRR